MSPRLGRPRGPWLALLAGGLLVAAARARPADAHPLHTTLTEISYDPAARLVRMSVRVFVDDFSAAVLHGRAAAPGAPIVLPPDTAMVRYLASRVALRDGRGRMITLLWCGTRRSGDLLFVCLRAPAARPPAGARLRNAILTEIFPDQVNIVQAALGGARQTVLFTPGDGAKLLR